MNTPLQAAVDGSLADLRRGTRERRGATMVVVGALLLVLATWSAIGAVLMRSHAAAIESETRVLERMSLAMEEQARHLLSSVHTFLWNADQLFTLDPQADPRTDARFLSLVQGLRVQSEGHIDVRLVGEDGELVYLNEPPAGSAEQRFQPPAASQGGMQVGEPMPGIAPGHWELPVSYPLAARPSGMRRVVAAIDSLALVGLYEEARTKPDGSLALVHRNGRVFARAPAGPGFLGKSIAGGELWTVHLPQKARATAVLPASVIDNRDRLASYRALPDLPLVVLASSSMDDVLAGWSRSLAGILAVGVIATALILFVAWRLLRLLATIVATRAKVEDQALRDALTGLPNRRMFHDRLEQALKRADRKRHSVALLFIDLDLFKEVNDTLGHSLGDQLLKDAASRLLSSVRESDTIARLGGDEFTVIMSDLSAPSSVQRVAETILGRLAQPFKLGQEVAWISASIGITFYPDDAQNAEDLIKNADQAMYAAKNDGRNRYSYFTHSLQVAAQNRKRLMDDLRDALAQEQFQLHYQPIVEMKSGRITRAEALLRWQHPARGLIAPDEFVPILEETGLIAEVGDWVFRQAAMQVQAWRATLDPGFQISINKSPVQFRQHYDTLARWERFLGTLQLPGSSIAIEITEGLLMDVNEHAAASLGQISRAGIGLSLDDFGTGYSSLSYLKKFDIDSIKIDRSFVEGIESDANDIALCEAMIVMAHKLGLKVIAEGVETQAQRDMLLLVGCDHAQGYFYSKPLPAADFEALVRQANMLVRVPALPEDMLSAR